MPNKDTDQIKRLRPPVKKERGVTPSERYLANLAEKTFLNLWSFPSPFRDKKKGGSGDGKELCDLLVVCGKYVIIFSEKTISWPNGSLELAWKRWAKRAIRDAAKQAKGAERWITEYPKRIFLDRNCNQPFPINLPSANDMIIHRIVVARGAAESCKTQVPGSSGSLIIRPEIKGEAHWEGPSGQVKPFSVGDIEPTASFVHVLNEFSLDVLMSELDTIRDFVDYLDKKVLFIRSGHLVQAIGEENLFAHYAIRINDQGEHDFISKMNPKESQSKSLEIDGLRYTLFSKDSRYIAKKKADEISYLWDNLIQAFTNHMLDGTSITLGEYKFDLRKNELGVRYMALERRFSRRSHGQAVRGALETGRTKDIFFRMMISLDRTRGSETAFFIITFKYREKLLEEKLYQQYRIARTNLAHAYARGILERFSHLKRVIGIACEPPYQPHGMSEDMVYAEQKQWTQEERLAIQKECKRLNILRDDIKSRRWSEQEFPDVE